jgi:hypothetical protein
VGDRAPREDDMESSKSTAYAFMIMLAGLATIGYLGRASAEVSAPQPETIAPAPGTMGAPGYQAQLGLIQTAVVGVSQLDATGAFGRPAPMPIFQIIQLQPAGFAPQRQASLEAPPAAMPPQMQAPEQGLPQGMSMTPSPQMTVTLCDIKGVKALTQSSDACATAGGTPLAQ